MQWLRKHLDPYILAMFATVALATLAPARGEEAKIASWAADAGIVFLFFLYGVRLSLADAAAGMAHWRLQLGVLLITFGLFPLLGLGFAAAATAVALPSALVTGLVFLCVLPSTVQSSIAFTSIARGNVSAALCAASASNVLGVFITPLLAGWLLHAAGAAVSLGVLRDIVLQLLVPFFAGQLFRRWIGGWVRQHKGLLTYADRGSILLIIYVAFSKGMVSGVWSRIQPQDLAILFVLLALLLASALAITFFIGRRILKLEREDEIVLQFCGSKKSLASGLPIAAVIFAGPLVGLIVSPLLLFHQLQLIVCAVLARRYGSRDEVGQLAPARI